MLARQTTTDLCMLVFANAFIMLSFASELALGPDPLPYLVFPRKFVMAAKTIAKFWILYH